MNNFISCIQNLKCNMIFIVFRRQIILPPGCLAMNCVMSKTFPSIAIYKVSARLLCAKSSTSATPQENVSVPNTCSAFSTTPCQEMHCSYLKSLAACHRLSVHPGEPQFSCPPLSARPSTFYYMSPALARNSMAADVLVAGTASAAAASAAHRPARTAPPRPSYGLDSV